VPANAKLIDLRKLLAERAPHARFGLPTARPAAVTPTGAAELDEALDGGLPAGATVELVADGPGSGSAQILHALLARAAADGRFAALVDGSDSFDVDAAEDAVLARLLWVRCRSAGEALQAVDLILRDRNFPIVALDLKLNPPSELRKISSSAWRRLARLQENHRTTLLVITPQPLVSGPAVRIRADARLNLGALDEPPAALAARLRFRVERRAGSAGAARTSEAAG
jgi:RecA/RadA recombinase